MKALDVLVSPRRIATRLTDLTDCETADIFNVSKKVQAMLEKHYKTNSTSVAVQDGPDAGQTVSVGRCKTALLLFTRCFMFPKSGF